MFQNCICNSPKDDEYLYEKVKSVYVDLVYQEIQYYDDMSDSEIKQSLCYLFNESFVRYNFQKAKDIIFDLYDIAKSDKVRSTLPPLHTYAMYRLILNASEYFKDIGFNYLDEELIKYINNNYNGYDKELIINWFKDINSILDDFVDIFDDEYIYEDYWEYIFFSQINGKEFLYDKNVEEMLQLMPRDIVHEWLEIKNDKDAILKRLPLAKKILNFKQLVESTGYKAFDLKNLKEEIGRTLLHFYMLGHGYREAEMAAGKSDLILPNEKVIIETKIWRDKNRFISGINELSAYLESQSYSLGYYIIFDKTKKSNTIIKENGNKEVFWIKRKNNIWILCIFVKINPLSPSKL